jgi:hypothetical protein
MSESKQTAVDWLRQELLKRDMDISIRELFNQAKEMDIQQKIEISKNSYIAGYLDNQSKIDDSMNFPNDYINETYGGK